MKNLFELLTAMCLAVVLVIAIPFLMINDARAVID